MNAKHYTWQHFIREFPADPEHMRSLADVEAVEKIPAGERFTCNTLYEALEKVCELKGDDLAITYLPSDDLLTSDPKQWTYNQYKDEVIAAANLFHGLGIRSGDSVAFLCPNIPEMLFGMWGAQIAGICAPINPYLQPEQILSVANEADARVLVAYIDEREKSYLERALKVLAESPLIEFIVLVGDCATVSACIENADLEREHLLAWHECIARQNKSSFDFERTLSGNEIASYFHTGGTTGQPKLVQHTHRAAVLNVCQMALTGPVSYQREGKVRYSALCGLPLFHCSAVYVSGLLTIMSGGELVLAGQDGFRNPALVENFWALIERYQITFFATVPTVYAALLDQKDQHHDTSSLQYCSCGASPMAESMLLEFQKRTGADIIEGYGMSELTAVATSQYLKGSRLVGSVGMRVPYHDVRTVILDDRGNIVRECATNEIGVVLHKGPSVMSGYKQASANAGAWPEEGWLNSGDMGRVDAQGNLWLTGRSKDLIIRGGHNIDPLITEAALTAHPGVVMAAAVGKPDAYAGELPAAYVVLAPGASVSEDELKVFARKHAAERAAAPSEVIIIDELPLTAVGKVFKPDLRKDIIARTYKESAEATIANLYFEAQTIEDTSYGTKVILRVKPQDAQGEIDLGQVVPKLSAVLDKLSIAWQVEAYPNSDSGEFGSDA